MYRGRLVTTEAPVAIKVARPDIAIAEYLLDNEIRALQRVGTPVAPALLGHGTVPGNGRRYVVLEFIDCPLLARVVAKYPAGMPWSNLRECARALLDAVHSVHELGLAHGDLKPHNVFMATGQAHIPEAQLPVARRPMARLPMARLIDFGSAVAVTVRDGHRALPEPLMGIATGSTPVSTDGAVLGTAAYMAPEQCAVDGKVDRRTDVYALGVILYQLATGNTPFSGTRGQLLQAHLNHRPLPPSRVRPMSAEVDRVIMKCLAKEPDLRFENAGSLRDALAHAWADSDRITGAVAAIVDEPASGAAKKPRTRVERPMLHLFLDADVQLAELRHTLQQIDGQLAHVDGTRMCALFDATSDATPFARALRAAEILIGSHLCRTVILDLDTVTVRQRRRGAVGYRSRLFDSVERYPTATDPPGVLLGSAVADLLPGDAVAPVVLRAGLRALHTSSERLATTATSLATHAPLVGRDAVRDELVAHASACFSERRATIATVIGERGYGKSHLCAEVAGRILAENPGVRIIDLRVSPDWRDDPSQLRRALLVRTLEVSAHLGAEGLRERVSAMLGQRLTPESWTVLGWALQAIADDDPGVTRLQAVPGALHHALVRAMGQVLQAAAAREPTCLFLDDAHFADQATLDALEFATLEPTPVPLWIQVLARPTLSAQRPEWAERCARPYETQLQALDEDSAAALCRILLQPAENVPTEVIELLVERTRGVPVLIVELIRGLSRRGLLQRHERGDMWYVASEQLDALPDMPLVAWLVHQELDSLPDELLGYLRLLALLYGDTSLEDIDGILLELDRAGHHASHPLTASAFLPRLRAAGLVVERRERRVGFRNTLVRDSVRVATPKRIWRRVHDAAYRYYTRVAQEATLVGVLQRAYHAEHSGREAQACALYLTLADRAAAGHAYVRAERLFSRALALAPVDAHKQRLSALRGRASMRYRSGRFHDSARDFEAALGLLDQAGSADQIHVLLDYATALDWMSEYRRSRDLVERAQEVERDPSDQLIAARLLLGIGRSQLRFSRLRSAQDALQSAVSRAEAVGDPGYETLVIALVLLTLTLPMLDAVDETEAVIERLIALCEDRGDRMHLATGLVNRRVVCIARKQAETALRDAARCIALSRELGLTEVEYVCEYNLGEMLYQLGNTRDAWPHVNRAMVLEERRPAGADRPMARLLSARLLAFEARDDEARAAVGSLLDHQRQAKAAEQTEALFLPAEVLHLDMLDLICRRADEPEWLALRARARRDAVEQELLEVVEMHGICLFRQGHTERARAVFAEALELAVEIPNIMEERLRACMQDTDSGVSTR